MTMLPPNTIWTKGRGLFLKALSLGRSWHKGRRWILLLFVLCFLFAGAGAARAFFGSGGLIKVETLPTFLLRVAADQAKKVAMEFFSMAQQDWMDLWATQEEQKERHRRKMAQVSLTAKQVQTEAMMAGFQTWTDDKTMNASQSQIIKHEVDKALPDPETQAVICNTLTARQLFMQMRGFADHVAEMVAQGLMLHNRGPNADGSGPKRTRDQFLARCGKMEGGNPISFANPIDGYSDACIPEVDKKKPTLFDFIDADLKYETLSGDLALEVPPVKEETVRTEEGDVKVSRFDPDYGNDAQLRYIAAVQQLHHLFAYEPPAPHGKEMETPEGAAAAAQRAHCMVLKSALIKPGARRVGMLSRPNCSKMSDRSRGDAGMDEGDPAFAKICLASMDACAAARAVGVEIPISMDRCSKGLSLYEIGWLSAHICSAPKRMMKVIDVKGGTSKVLDGADVCSQSLTQMAKWRQKSDKSYRSMLKGIKDLNACWQGYQKQLLPR